MLRYGMGSRALGFDNKEIILSKSQPWQPIESLVVSTVGVWQHKKDDYVSWY